MTASRDLGAWLRQQREQRSWTRTATDEPAAIEGANSTTVLVRRVKQSVA